MAKIRSGVLGNTRGKVAGVVGSQWKNVNYLREYVLPANPNTAAQQVQRTKMADIVEFCKPLVGPVFNAYTDRFQKAMSGFNYFIKQNIVEFDGTLDYAALKLTEGKLHAPGDFAVEKAGVNLNFTWDETLGNNGALTDKIYGVAINTVSGLWWFFDAEAVRDDELASITVPIASLGVSFECYLWAIKYSGTLVDSISLSQYAQGTDP